jgi:hypothetical protein
MLKSIRTTKTILREITANLLMGIPYIAHRRIARGRTSEAPTIENLDRYAFGMVRNNPAIARLIVDADVCEVGPGDHLATGLTVLGHGAASYTALDRFAGDYGGPAAMRWYRFVREHWPAEFPAWRPALDAFPELPVVRTIPAGIEDLSRLPSNEFDIVLSQAVGEHVIDIYAFSRATHRMLKPGGVALHDIDFSSHGLFGDEETFLKIPEPIWWLMGSNRGLPNRKRKDDFVRAFSIDFDVEVVQESRTWASFLLKRG